MSMKGMYEFVHLEHLRIPIDRVRPHSSTTTNCTASVINSTIKTCDVSSRAFGKISVAQSSALENLVNEADISGIAVKNQIFAQCTSLNGMTGDVNDGILGLAYPRLTRGGEKPVFYNMWSQVSSAEIDCTIYDNDIDAISMNPFYARRSGPSGFNAVTYTRYTNRGSTPTVIEFNIFNDVNPSSSIYCLKDLQKLQLINTNLTILPDIKNFQNLTSLVIQTDYGSIDQHLPSGFGQLISLLNLKLSNIKNLEDLPDEIKYLIQLQSLTLENIPSFNKIPDESIGKLTKLNTLNLIDLPNLSNLPSTMINFELLQQLEITKTNITNIQLDTLTSLNSLKITSNLMLQTVQIRNLPLLQSLAISPNKKLISLDIENLPSITTISIADNTQLQNVSFINLPSITTISIIDSTQLQNVSFINVPSIKNLDLSRCQLTIFPESILTLKSLVTLVMTSNQLSTIPLTLSSDLPNLQVLNLANNKLQGNIFQPTLVYIRELYLRNNSLTCMDGIGKHKSLQRLDLDSNQISSIPLEIMKLSSTLKQITMNNNLLNHIPYQMTNMGSLESFSVGRNNFTSGEREYLIKLFSSSPVKLYFSN
ncbi:unnamed protein product [Rotaria sp. Silwood1]|nr:unnamed protein product [Rotaria sp. Silwood1]CAF1653993.1 unnamed protein product [Rotaria sp. Silwood1]